MNHKLKTGIKISALTMSSLCIINHCINITASMNDLLSKNSGNIFYWHHGNIFYTKTGSGSPILLLHDLSPLSSSYEWVGIVQKLSKTNTVYCVDLPGCGRSDKPYLTYTSYFYVQFLKDFVKEIIGTTTDVIATGLSASFTIMACHENPELFRKIFMVNPESISKLRQMPEKNSKITKTLMDLPIIGTTIYNIYMSRENIEYLFTEKYFFNPFNVKKKTLHVYYESAHLNNSRGKYLLSSIHGSYLNVDVSRVLKNIKNEIFIIVGNKLNGSNQIIEDYRSINSQITVMRIEDTKLYPQLEQPEQFTKCLASDN